jgi:glycosyltransferase involved in cell wall biosynthesis
MLNSEHITLSIIVPCYNEQQSIPLFYNETLKVVSSISQNIKYEFIFIDDGSKDNTLHVLQELSQKAQNNNNNVHYISFSKNFGKEAAMLAGLQAAQGKYIIILDADLQHPPALIPRMLDMLTSGYDCVIAKRNRTGDSPTRTFLSKKFYKIISYLADMEIADGLGDFRIMTKQYVDAVLSLTERNRFSKGIFPWIGFNTTTIEYENAQRVAGETKWSTRKLFAYSMDGITSFSSKLLTLVTITGVILFLLSLTLLIIFIARKFIWGVSVDGFITIVCLITFFSAIIMLSIGILGLYVSKLYTEVKMRPHYIIKEAK